MSVASQFFPSSGGGGGGESTNIGGGTIPVEIVGMSAGGGSGSGVGFPSPYPARGTGGTGGGGALFHAHNYYLNPGTTYPITIGAGGPGGIAGGPENSTGTTGTNGGHTSFNNPACPIRVEGGGGGGINSSPYDPRGNACRCGLPGGTGGGGGAFTAGGDGIYNTKKSLSFGNFTTYSYPTPTGTEIGGTHFQLGGYVDGQPTVCPWGCISGYPGTPGTYCYPSGNPAVRCGGCGGFAGANLVCITYQTASTSPNQTVARINCCSLYINNNITGNLVSYGSTIATGGGRGQSGSNAPGCSGCPGVLVIKWPSTVGAAPPTGFPGATDISPQTPGYYTYCFTSSGSITLP